MRIECHEFGKIDPTSTSTRAATYGVTVYVNVEPGHFEKYGHYNHVKEETLLEKQIALDFAKTLRNSDKILIKGQIAGVFVSTYARDGRISTPDYAEISKMQLECRFGDHHPARFPQPKRNATRLILVAFLFRLQWKPTPQWPG